MNTNALLDQAELSFAAYAQLVPGATQLQLISLEMSGKGMSAKEAEEFSRRYPTVVAQFNDTGTSFSATVFADTGDGGGRGQASARV